MTNPSIVDYTSLLHRHGVGSDEAAEYRDQYPHHEKFQRRAAVMDQLFEIKDSIREIEG